MFYTLLRAPSYRAIESRSGACFASRRRLPIAIGDSGVRGIDRVDPSSLDLPEHMTRVGESWVMSLKAVALDWGHTVMDECRDGDVPLDVRPVHLMPGVSEALPQIALPLALWANTRVAAEPDVRGWLERAGLSDLFRWVITSVDAGARKPAPQFFQYALARCGLVREEVLLVGNQLDTDVSGAEAFGISTVWLSGPEYRSADDVPCNAAPTYTIRTLHELPALLQRLRDP